MEPGYDQPLYLLPFDHRHSYMTGLFHFTPPLTHAQHDQVADSKWVIYEGYKQALANGLPQAHAGIPVDEEFGADVLRDAIKNGYITALSTERSGAAEFGFEYGADYTRHIEAVNPAFVKVLVRSKPGRRRRPQASSTGAPATPLRYCRRNARRFMFELLVPATPAQLDSVYGDKRVYDRQLRPALMRAATRSLQDAGIEPDVWKIEGLDDRADCKHIVERARRDGRRDVGCIVLGRGADANKVVNWLETAASVPGYIGHAVGRTSFWDAVADYLAQKITRPEAVSRIAQRYGDWTAIFERARAGDVRSRLINERSTA